MPKLVIMQEGVILREYELTAERYTVGRRPENDIFLDDRTVSSEHAAVSLFGEPAITDLGSTNGTFVNGVAVAGKRALRHGDAIRIGQHELKYIDEQAQDMAATLVLAPEGPGRAASLCILDGEQAGKRVPLEGERVPLGKAGGPVAFVLREGKGFRLLPMGQGAGAARVNDAAVAAAGAVLADGDVVTLGKVRLRFQQG